MTGRRHSRCKGPGVEKEPQETRTGRAEELGNLGDTIEDEVKEAVFVPDRGIFINPSMMANIDCQFDRKSPGDTSLGVSV